MNFTRKIDRAMQWAGEKMGAESKATVTEEFKILETEMDTRHDGMEKLHKSMTIYSRWMSRRCDALEDRNRSVPAAVLGRSMAAHGAELHDGSELGRRLASMGSANESIAEMQSSYIDCINATWMQQIERNLAMMKEYDAARKKLESRRLAYDASMGKMQKGKKDDTRLEEELRVNKTKFDDTTEDVYQRMLDIKEAETDSVGALTSFLDAQLEYHERAAEELRRLRRTWGETSISRPSSQGETVELQRVHTDNSIPSHTGRPGRFADESDAYAAPPPRLARTLTSRPPPPPPPSTRPPVTRSATFDIRQQSLHASNVHRAGLSNNTNLSVRGAEEAYGDDASVCSNDNSSSPVSRERSVSPATSYGSARANRSHITESGKKAPPPPPVNRARKPPPPPVPRKVNVGY